MNKFSNNWIYVRVTQKKFNIQKIVPLWNYQKFPWKSSCLIGYLLALNIGSFVLSLNIISFSFHDKLLFSRFYILLSLKRCLWQRCLSSYSGTLVNKRQPRHNRRGRYFDTYNFWNVTWLCNYVRTVLYLVDWGDSNQNLQISGPGTSFSGFSHDSYSL